MRICAICSSMSKPKLPFTVTDDMRQLMDAAREGFFEDTTLAVSVARAGAVLAAQRGHPLEREEIHASAPPHQCPPNHPHGSRSCHERHGCRCATCEQAKADRAAERRTAAARRPEARPVIVRHVAPTKVATKGQQQGAYVPGSRQITSRATVELPQGVEHGGSNAYSRYSCRCAACRSWKAESNRATKAKRAEKAALQQWNSRHPDDE